MADRRWLDNAFFTDGSNGKNITAIMEYEDTNGKRVTQVMKISDVLPNGTRNPDYDEVIKSVSFGKIDQNTKDRQSRKKQEQVQNDEKKRENEKARELEKLFELKLKAFEIPQIKNSKNRVLKSKLRKSKSELEVTAHVTMILWDEYQNEQQPDSTE